MKFLTNPTAGESVVFPGSGSGPTNTVVSTSSDYVVVPGNIAILCDASSSPLVITLGDDIIASVVVIKKTDSTANIVAVTVASAGTIDGEVTTYNLELEDEFVAVVRVGPGQWWVAAE